MRYKRDLFCAENMNFKKEIEGLKVTGASDKDIEEVIVEVLGARLDLNSVVNNSSIYAHHCELYRKCYKKYGCFEKELLDVPKNINPKISDKERRRLAKQYEIFTDFFFNPKNTSVAQLTEKLGRSRAFIYANIKQCLVKLRHPRSKQEIYQRILERVMNQN